MSLVSFRKPLTSGYAYFHQRACGPMLDRIRDAKVFALYMGDLGDCVMFREACRDCNHHNLDKRDLMHLIAELRHVAEAMTEPNPFTFERWDGERIEYLRTTSDETREEARRLMEDAGYTTDEIEIYISGGRDKELRLRAKERQEKLLADIRTRDVVEVQTFSRQHTLSIIITVLLAFAFGFTVAVLAGKVL